MNHKVNPIPEGYHTVTPYMILQNASNAIDFYKQAFGAIELFRSPKPDGRVAHAEIQVGDSRIMLADEFPDMGALSPTTIGGSPITLMLYVEDVDKFTDRAVAAGAKVTRPIQNQFYGDRLGMVADPFGYNWCIATHIEDVSPEEIQRRAAEMHGEAC